MSSNQWKVFDDLAKSQEELRKFGYEMAPLLLALVLGDRLEENFRLALTLSGGSYATFADQAALIVVLATAVALGARSAGVGLGLWGAVGLLVLVVAFGVNPTSPPIDVMLIILAVIMAASVMEAAGGIDFLVRIAERIIRANPKYVTIVAPLTTWTFTFLAGTGHIVYPLLPVIYETAHRSGIRPERPMAVATIASQQAITASPVAAATAAMIGLFSEKGLSQWGLPEILMICVPATLVGVIAAAIVGFRRHRRRLAA